MLWHSGDSYHGELKNGDKHGHGKYTYTCADGGVYEGEWKDGERQTWLERLVPGWRLNLIRSTRILITKSNA